jgi:outer membrane lipoprotein SlyB
MRVRMLVGLLVVSAAPLTTGCSHMSKTAQGAGIGGAAGAGLGALVGSASGNAGKGALVGAGVGTVLGGLAGNAEDQRDKADMEARVRDAEARNPANQPMNVDDVIRMAQEKQSDRIIIRQMQTTGSTFNLTTDDLSRLNSGGVSGPVIEEMQNRRPGTVRHVHVAPPPPRPVIYQHAPPPDVVYVPVAPPPPPPPSFGVGVHIRN